MSTAASHSLMTAEQLLDQSFRLGRCELIRGELVMMSPAGGYHGSLASELAFHIDVHVRQHKLGKVFAAETGFVLERNPDTVRAPDIAFIAADRVAEARTPKYIPIPPDLAVEVNSPNDRAGEVAEKVNWWLRCGTRAVWVVDPHSKTVTTYCPDGSARVFHHEQTLDGGAVLPGFTLALDQFFAD